MQVEIQETKKNKKVGYYLNAIMGIVYTIHYCTTVFVSFQVFISYSKIIYQVKINYCSNSNL